MFPFADLMIGGTSSNDTSRERLRVLAVFAFVEALPDLGSPFVLVFNIGEACHGSKVEVMCNVVSWRLNVNRDLKGTNQIVRTEKVRHLIGFEKGPGDMLFGQTPKQLLKTNLKLSKEQEGADMIYTK
jgi:hypothetical protein